MTRNFTIDRNKFKTELGRKCYDKIMELNPPSVDFVFLMLTLANGDEKRKILYPFLEKCTDWKDLHDFIIERWG